METLTRPAFEAALQELGYAEARPFEYDRCKHAATVPCAVYTMPTSDCCEELPATYGDLGWFVYTGCEDCCMEVGGVLFCGGLYVHTRIFRGDEDVTGTTNLGVSELQRADAPLEE